MKVIPRLGVSYSNENKLGRQSSPPLNSAWDNKEPVIRPRTNQRPECKIGNTKKTNTHTRTAFYDSVPPARVMIHEVQNKMKLSTSDRMTFLLFNYVTKSAVFTRLNDVSVCYYFQRRKFQKHDYKIDQSIEFSTKYNLLGRLTWQLHCCLVKYKSIHVV